MSFELLPLVSGIPGQQINLAVHRFGPTSGQKVYIQAGLHADEHPGMLVAQHLIALLGQLEQAGKLNAQFVIVPFANPVGLKQRIFGHVNGRCDLATGQNFNRGMAVDRNQIDENLLSLFTKDPEQNDIAFRQWLISQTKTDEPMFEVSALHKKLLSLSLDAHYMLDLHCDDVAFPHVFYGTHQPEDGRLLSQCLSAQVSLEEDVTGTVAFDGTHTQPWVLAQQLSTETLFKQPCFAATVELRGQTDVNPTLAAQDAQGILNFFMHKGLITGTAEKLDAALPVKTIGVAQVKVVTAPTTGIVTYHCELGDHLNEGDLIAKIVLLDQPEPTEVEVCAPISGFMFSQTQHYFVSPGQTIGMLATDEVQQAAGTQLAF